MKNNGLKRLFAWEVFDSILKRGEAEVLGSRIPGGVTSQTVRNWCREPQSEGANSTGRSNFLDVARIVIEMVRERDGELTRAYPIGEYIAGLLEGAFVPMPASCSSPDSEFVLHSAAVLKEVGEFMEKARQSYMESTPGKITREEALECRKELNDCMVALIQFRLWIDRMEDSE